MRPLIVHFHIYKNAGSSVDANLQRCLGTRWAAFEGSDGQQPIDFAELLKFLDFNPSLLAVSSHQLRPPIRGGLDIFPIVFLRHPFDRIWSIFEYERKNGRLNPALGSEPTLRGFCEWALTRPPEGLQCRNAQSIFLSRANFDRAPPDLIENGQNDIGARQAEAFLESVPVVGIVDRFEESLARLQSAMPPVFGVQLKAVVENASRDISGSLKSRLIQFRRLVGDATCDALEAENQYDLALYERYSRHLSSPETIGKRARSILPFTGERFVPGADLGADTRQEHMLRYQAAAKFVAGRRVLDAACGEGYGSSMLAESAAAVVGLDISEEAIACARQSYGSRPNLEFGVGSVGNLPFPDASFDAVVSFETIEHVDAAEQRRFISEVVRVLKPDGIFIASTPNRINYSDRTGLKNRYHVQELTPAEFMQLLAPLRIHQVYAQSMMAFAAIWRPEEPTYAFHGPLVPDEADDTFLIAVCGRELSTPPTTSLAALSYDRSLSFTRIRRTLVEKERWIEDLSRWGKGLKTEVVSHRKEIEKALENCGAATAEVAQLRARMEALLADLDLQKVKAAELTTELQQARELFAAKEVERADLAARLAAATEEAERMSGWAAAQDRELARIGGLLAAANKEVADLGAWGRERDNVATDLEAKIAALQAETQRLVTWGRERDAAVLAAQRWAIANDAETARISALLAKAQKEIEALGTWGQERDRAVSARDGRIAELQQEVQGLATWAKERDATAMAARRLAAENEAEHRRAAGLLDDAMRERARLETWGRERDAAAAAAAAQLATAEAALRQLRAEKEAGDAAALAAHEKRLADLVRQQAEEHATWAREREEARVVAQRMHEAQAAELRSALASLEQMRGEVARLAALGKERDGQIRDQEQRLGALQAESASLRAAKHDVERALAEREAALSEADRSARAREAALADVAARRLRTPVPIRWLFGDRA